MKGGVFVFAGLLISIFAGSNEVISGKVMSVIDGNTVVVITEDQSTYKIMLHGIDCPELGQDYGDVAKRFLERLLLDKPVTAEMKGKDRWGTRLGVIIIDGDTDPRHALLKEGLAWTAEVNPIPELEGLKEKARAKGKGLWKQDNPMPPWTFRRQQSRLQTKWS
jgi:endonuclease YncB( thermonuclease family)